MQPIHKILLLAGAVVLVVSAISLFIFAIVHNQKQKHPECKKGFSTYPESPRCYRVYKKAETLAEAIHTCKSNNASIAYPNDKHENQFLADIFRKFRQEEEENDDIQTILNPDSPANTTTTAFYLGIGYSVKHNHWVSLSHHKRAVNYTNWEHGMPVDPKRRTAVVLRVEGGTEDHWENVEAIEKYPFICEELKKKM